MKGEDLAMVTNNYLLDINRKNTNFYLENKHLAKKSEFLVMEKISKINRVRAVRPERG